MILNLTFFYIYSLFFSSGSLLQLNGVDLTPFNNTVNKESSFSSFYNPALLPFSKKQTTFGFIVSHQRFKINLENREQGLDISESIFDAREYTNGGIRSLTTHPLPTSYLNRRNSYDPSNTVSYFTISLNQPLIKNKLGLGAVIILPVSSLQKLSPFFNDEREQYFTNSLHYELFEDRYQMQTISGGIGYKPFEFLSLGAGILMSMSTSAVSSLFIPNAAEQNNFYLAPQVEIAPSFTPYFGSLFQINKDWHHTLTVRFEEKMETKMKTDMSFFLDKDSDFNGEGKEFNLIFGYLPLRVNLGSYYKYKNIEFLSTINYSKWSDYINRMGYKPIDKWFDTVSVSLSSILNFNNGKQLAAGIKFQPSPVPNSTGKENYLDNDKLSFSLSFRYPFSYFGKKFSLTFNFQYQQLISRTITKDLNRSNSVFDEFPLSVDAESGSIIDSSIGFQSNNPGYPNFNHKGNIFTGSVMLTLF
jgi:long-chain fatty acid transport protein